MKPKIYVDMDDVIVKFSEHIIDIHNKELNKDFNIENLASYNWADTGTDVKYFRELINRKGTFLNAPANMEIIKYIEELKNEGYEIYILSHPQWNEWCCHEKIEWIKKYMPFFDIENIIFTKQKHLLAKSNTILFDDNPINLRNFKECGGIAIGKEHGWNNFEGMIVSSGENFYKLVENITVVSKCYENILSNIDLKL